MTEVLEWTECSILSFPAIFASRNSISLKGWMDISAYEPPKEPFANWPGFTTNVPKNIQFNKKKMSGQ